MLSECGNEEIKYLQLNEIPSISMPESPPSVSAGRLVLASSGAKAIGKSHVSASSSPTVTLGQNSSSPSPIPPSHSHSPSLSLSPSSHQTTDLSNQPDDKTTRVQPLAGRRQPRRCSRLQKNDCIVKTPCDSNLPGERQPSNLSLQPSYLYRHTT